MIEHYRLLRAGVLIVAVAVTISAVSRADSSAGKTSGDEDVSAKDVTSAAPAAAKVGTAERSRGYRSEPLGLYRMTPLARALFHEYMRQEYAVYQERVFEEARQELHRKQQIWQGTTAELSPHPEVKDAQRLSAAPFLELFQRDVPAPEVRRDFFRNFLQPDSPDRCVGWRLCLRSADEVEDGWLVHVEAHANLLGPGFVICFSATHELWHVSREGELIFVEGFPEEVTPARVNARL
jgi:hypothetical protein